VGLKEGWSNLVEKYLQTRKMLKRALTSEFVTSDLEKLELSFDSTKTNPRLVIVRSIKLVGCTTQLSSSE
jgi:hypothetical protein